MRILVGVKRVIDYAVKVRVAADKKGALVATAHRLLLLLSIDSFNGAMTDGRPCLSLCPRCLSVCL